MSNNDDKHIEAYAHHKAALGAAHQISSAHQNYNGKAINFHEYMAKQHFNKIKSHINVGHRQFTAEKKLPNHSSLIGKPHPHDSLLDKAEEMSKTEKTYSDPVEILELIREGTKKALEDLAKGQAMQMGANKNPGGPRGNYTGKSSIMKPQGAPKVPTAPKPPTALKPPMPPKPPMAKAEELEKAKHIVVKKNPDKSNSGTVIRDPKRELDSKTYSYAGAKIGGIVDTYPKVGSGEKVKKDEASLEKGAIDEMKGAVSKMKDTVAKMPEKGLKMVKPLPSGEEKTVVAKPKALPKPQENYGKDPHRGVSKAEKEPSKMKIVDSRTGPNAPHQEAKKDLVDKVMGDMKAAQAAKVMNAPKAEAKKEDKPKMGLGMNKSEELEKAKHVVIKKNPGKPNSGMVIRDPKRELDSKTYSYAGAKVDGIADTYPKVGSGEKVKKDEADLSKADIVPVKPKMGGKDPNSKMMTDQAMGQAHKDATAPIASAPVKLPTPAEHAQRADMYSEHMSKGGHFDDLGACGLCRKAEHDGMC